MKGDPRLRGDDEERAGMTAGGAGMTVGSRGDEQQLFAFGQL